jgi:uncharacterized protein
MKTVSQVEDILKLNRSFLFKKYHLKEMGVFGSYLRNEQKKESDLDILVDYEQTPGLFSFVRLEEELSRLLGIQVDLVMKSALKPHIGKRILEEIHFIA